MGAGMLVLTKPLVIDDRAVEECAHPGVTEALRCGVGHRGGECRAMGPHRPHRQQRDRERGGSETALDKRVAE